MGVYKQLFIVIISATNYLPMGFGTCAFYFLPRETDKKRQVVLNIVLVMTTMGLFGSFIALAFPQVYATLLGAPSLTQYAGYVALAIPLAVLCQGFEAILMAHQEVEITAFFFVLIQATRTFSLFIAVVQWGTPVAILCSFLIQSTITVLLMFWDLGSRFPGFWRQFDGKLLREQIIYATPLGLSSLLLILQVDMHTYFVSNFLGAATLALYTQGCFQLPIMGLVAESSTAVVLPRMSEMRKNGETDQILALTARVMRKLSIPAFAVFFYFITVTEPFIVFLFTPKFRESAPIFFVNLFLILTTVLPLDPLTRVYPELRFYFVKFRVLLVSAMAALLWWTTPKLGMLGAIAVVVLVGFLDKLFVAWKFTRILKIGSSDLFQFHDTGRAFLAASVAAVCSLVLRYQLQNVKLFYLLAFTSITFAVVYVAMLILSGFFREEEKAMIRRYLPTPLKPVFR